jgi:hypothetical protein
LDTAKEEVPALHRRWAAASEVDDPWSTSTQFPTPGWTQCWCSTGSTTRSVSPRRLASAAYDPMHDGSGRSSRHACGESNTSTRYPRSSAASFPRSCSGRPRVKHSCSGTVQSGCRKPCFGPSATRPLPVANNSVVLRERVVNFAAADLAFEKLQVLKNMRNEATEVQLDYVGQNASQRCKV